MSEKIFHLEGSFIQLIIKCSLCLKIEKGLLQEVSLKAAVNTVKKVIKQCFFDRDTVPVREFLIDLRNLAGEEGYVWFDTGVDGNPVVNISELSEELESIDG